MSTLLRHSFKGKNLDAQRIAARQAGKLITGISNSIKQAIRNLVTRSISQGVPPRELADQIRQVIGLSDVQESAVAAYRKTLKESGVSQQRQRLMVERIVAKKRRDRALTIARFEVMDALNTAKLEGWRDDVKEGNLSKRAKKGVLVTEDEKLCPVCASTEGKKYALDAVITKGRQNPPFHPRCRCSIRLFP